MSKILNLAQSFEEKSKQQVSDTEKTLKSAFDSHEQSIVAALKLSEKIISDGIRAQQSRLTNHILKTWIWLPLTLATVLLASWGVIYTQGNMISSNWETISQQKKNIKELKSKGGLIQIEHCGSGKTNRLCVKIDTNAKKYGKGDGKYPWMIPEGY